MKEVVYAWYPPAIDAYKSNRETGLDSYTKECLYRYSRSRFQDPRQCCIVREETSGQGHRREETSGKGQRDELPANGGLMDEVELKAPKISFRPRPPTGSLPLSVRSKSAVEGKPGMVLPEEPGPCRRLQRVGSSMQATRGRASSAWVKSRGWLAETSTSCGVAVKDPAPEGTSPGSVQAHQAVPMPSSSSFRLTTDGHAARVQSAVIRRPGSQVVKRSVQSAGPERQTSATFADPSPAVVWGSANKDEHIRRRARPSGPTPRRWREEEEREGMGDVAADGLGMEFPLDYDEQVKIHGWKMEIPGDPLRIKRGCLAKRLSTTIVLPVEEVSRKPGRNHMQSSDTFFYNTIPRMPMTFTIHPDWPSEILQTKRMELKAKTGADGGHRRTCRMADFSFVY